MNRPVAFAFLSSASFLVACASGGRWSETDARDAVLIEMQVDDSGKPREIEYHIAPDKVPAVVREAMDKLHPGGQATAAEKEYVGSDLYWELTKNIGGREIEAMFRPDGRLHSEEIEVAADGVPQPVRDAARNRLGGTPTKWEEIHDADRKLVEYHAKGTANGQKLKLELGTDGKLQKVVREVPSEIEVPID